MAKHFWKAPPRLSSSMEFIVILLIFLNRKNSILIASCLSSSSNGIPTPMCHSLLVLVTALVCAPIDGSSSDDPFRSTLRSSRRESLSLHDHSSISSSHQSNLSRFRPYRRDYPSFEQPSSHPIDTTYRWTWKFLVDFSVRVLRRLSHRFMTSNRRKSDSSHSIVLER